MTFNIQHEQKIELNLIEEQEWDIPGVFPEGTVTNYTNDFTPSVKAEVINNKIVLTLSYIPYLYDVFPEHTENPTPEEEEYFSWSDTGGFVYSYPAGYDVNNFTEYHPDAEQKAKLSVNVNGTEYIVEFSGNED